MSEKQAKVLIVDDEDFNMQILDRLLKTSGYVTEKAEDGQIAWDYLKAHQDIDIILLDRMMPNMDGMEVLAKIKETPHLKDIPVIMQTAASAPEHVVEGIQAGVYYYLTKPFDERTLLSIVDAAKSDAESGAKLRKELKESSIGVGLITMAQFKLRTVPEAYNLSYFLAKHFPNPDSAVVGLYALILNAIEHGNLGISYEERAAFKTKKEWYDEINRRLALPENKDKVVEVRYGHDDEQIKVYIKDDGPGFEAEQYLEFHPDRATHSHGRGIALANQHSFDEIEFLGNANELVCTVNLT